MAEWTHNICWDCWLDQEGEPRNPVILTECEIDICCWCSTRNHAGIYKRADPKETPCKGIHTSDLADL